MVCSQNFFAETSSFSKIFNTKFFNTKFFNTKICCSSITNQPVEELVKVLKRDQSVIGSLFVRLSAAVR